MQVGAMKRLGRSIALVGSCSILAFGALAGEPLRMVRQHAEWSWTGENQEARRVVRSELVWARDDGDFPKHDLRSVTLFQDQAGNRWVLESRRQSSPDRFTVSLRLLESGETVTVSMVHRGNANFFRVEGCGGEFELAEGQAATPAAEEHRRDLSARLSPAFLSAFAAVRPWLEKGYLGVNAAAFLGYAFDLSGSDLRSTLSQAVLQPLRPAPVDCAFDAAFGFPCSPEERPKDGRGLLYEMTSPPPKP